MLIFISLYVVFDLFVWILQCEKLLRVPSKGDFTTLPVSVWKMSNLAHFLLEPSGFLHHPSRLSSSLHEASPPGSSALVCTLHGPRTLHSYPFVSHCSIRAKPSSASMSIMCQAHSIACRGQTSHLGSSTSGPGLPALFRLRLAPIKAPLIVKTAPHSSAHQACSTDEAATSPGWDKESTLQHLKAQQDSPRASIGLHTSSSSFSVSFTEIEGADHAQIKDLGNRQDAYQQSAHYELPAAAQALNGESADGSTVSTVEETDTEQEEEANESDEVGTEVMLKMLEDFVGGANTRNRNQHTTSNDSIADMKMEGSTSDFAIINFYHLTDVEKPHKV